MKIAITGATGHLGRLVISRLKSRVPASSIVALVRTPAKAEGLGVEVRQTDYSSPATLDAGLKGMDTLLLISSSEVGHRAAQHQNVIDAALNNGVKWIVYTSLLHADTSHMASLASEHIGTEAALKRSKIAYTLLRNGWYTENYTASVPAAVSGGAFLGSAGEGKISSAARADYADAAVAVLTGQGHEGKTYELAGDTAYTLSDLAAEISRQTGKTIPYRNMPESEYAEVLQSFGLPEAVAKAYANFDTGASANALFDDSRTLSSLIGHPTTPLSSSVAEALKQ